MTVTPSVAPLSNDIVRIDPLLDRYPGADGALDTVWADDPAAEDDRKRGPEVRDRRARDAASARGLGSQLGLPLGWRAHKLRASRSVALPTKEEQARLKQRADEFKWTDDADVLPGEISDTVRRATERASTPPSPPSPSVR